MTDFSINVLASLIAGILVLTATTVLSNRARWILTGILGRLLDVDIEGVFSDKRASEADMRRELGRAKEVAILTGRGNELNRDTFDPIFLHRPAAKPLRIRVLLPRTDEPPESDWTEQRQHELAQFDTAFGRPGLLKEQIETTARFLDQYVSTDRAELRRFSCPHIGRVVITERCAYFTPYRRDSHGRDCPVYKYRRGDLYDNYTRLFDQLWGRDGAEAAPSTVPASSARIAPNR